MPRIKNTDITNYTIYKIACLDPNISNIYVGSTCDLKQRKIQHKNKYIAPKHKNRKVYQFIREHGGWDNWKFYVLEHLDCNKFNAELREEHYRQELNASLNMRICVRKYQKCIDQCDNTSEEHRRENHKQYYKANKDKILKQQKQYKEKNMDRINKYKKEYNKKYYERQKKLKTPNTV